MKPIKQFDKKLFTRRAFLILLDILIVNFVSYFSLLIRFDFNISRVPARYSEVLINNMIWYTIITIAIFWIFRLYHSLWKYASIEELTNIIYSCVLLEVIHYAGIHLFVHVDDGLEVMPRSFWPLELLLLLLCMVGTRFCYRTLRMLNQRRQSPSEKRIMVVGAGEAANIIIREIITSRYLEGKVVCVIDDNKRKIGSYIQGIRIVGNRYDIVTMAERYQITDIVIAIPTLGIKDRKQIVALCKETNCNLKILPGMYQIINEEVSVSRLRNVGIEDLLGRETVELDNEKVMGYVRDKVVMVTGGGGSIGSELCRQIVKYKPKRLIILDIYENNAYEIQQELWRKYPELDLVVLIASVRNSNRMEQIFQMYKPDVIYHAAAHKHVPLMEDSPSEAIKNNVYGTLKLARMSDKYGVKRFVQISTDKAVNPTNVMGASKRMCEMIIQAYNNRSNTEFVAVRFGNVLGSNGSVIPLFKKQIAAGGPVTVTHPDIIRYFMTIPEAVSLVLQAGALAKGGEIFVLDMGEPVKIDDLARNLIRLSGYVPDRDIEIKYTGLRPGEKLFEELLMDEEGMQNTENKMIHIGKPIEFDEEAFLQRLDEMYKPITSEQVDVRAFVKEMVPTYQPKS